MNSDREALPSRLTSLSASLLRRLSCWLLLLFCIGFRLGFCLALNWTLRLLCRPAAWFECSRYSLGAWLVFCGGFAFRLRLRWSFPFLTRSATLWLGYCSFY